MRVTGWNAGAANLLGYSASEAIGQRCAAVLQAFYPTGEPLCSVLCEGRSCVSSGEKWNIGACKIRHKNGQMISAGISTMVIPREAREPDPGGAIAVMFLREVGWVNPKLVGMQPLRVFTLGHFSLAIAGKGLEVDSWKRQQAVLVLKCLVNRLGRPVHRERLIDWLWPEADPVRGWQRLKVNVSFLREKLREAGASSETIETVGQSYILRRDAVWVDSDSFADLVAAGWRALKGGDNLDARARFEEAQSLYRGDYLEDEPYADWCAEDRGRLQELYIEMLSGMAQCYAEEGLYMEAAQICKMALFSDPGRESFLRALLENLVNFGQADWAEAQFYAWRRRLDEEHGLQPTDETMRVFKQLIGDRSIASC
jgi:DNA-binding SARP family transcriptional activator